MVIQGALDGMKIIKIKQSFHINFEHNKGLTA